MDTEILLVSLQEYNYYKTVNHVANKCTTILVTAMSTMFNIYLFGCMFPLYMTSVAELASCLVRTVRAKQIRLLAALLFNVSFQVGPILVMPATTGAVEPGALCANLLRLLRQTFDVVDAWNIERKHL